jgi:preprotein translocase subunit Sec63
MIHHISKSLAACGRLYPLRRNGTQTCARTMGSTASSAFPDYFGILGVERTFTQSPDELKAKYKNLMTKFHPDRHTTSSEEEKSQKASMASDVTRAYSVIEDPLARALHILELNGQAIRESDSVRIWVMLIVSSEHISEPSCLNLSIVA